MDTLIDRLRLTREGLDLVGWWMPIWVAVVVLVPLAVLAISRWRPGPSRLLAALFWAWLAFSVGTCWTVPAPSHFHQAVMGTGLLVIGYGLRARLRGLDTF